MLSDISIRYTSGVSVYQMAGRYNPSNFETIQGTFLVGSTSGNMHEVDPSGSAYVTESRVESLLEQLLTEFQEFKTLLLTK